MRYTKAEQEQEVGEKTREGVRRFPRFRDSDQVDFSSSGSLRTRQTLVFFCRFIVWQMDDILFPLHPSFARHHRNECFLDADRLPSLAGSTFSGSTQDLDVTEGFKRRNCIPTIETSDPVVDRSPETSPRFGAAYGRTPPNRRIRGGFSSSKLSALKRTTYHVLSFAHEKEDDKGREREDGLFLRAPLV